MSLRPFIMDLKGMLTSADDKILLYYADRISIDWAMGFAIRVPRWAKRIASELSSPENNI